MFFVKKNIKAVDSKCVYKVIVELPKQTHLAYVFIASNIIQFKIKGNSKVQSNLELINLRHLFIC